jgi:hypothetical protein
MIMQSLTDTVYMYKFTMDLASKLEMDKLKLSLNTNLNIKSTFYLKISIKTAFLLMIKFLTTKTLAQ